MACNCGGNANSNITILQQADAADTFGPVSISVQSEVQTVPGGFALTGFLDVEKMLNVTCNDSTKTFFLEKKLPFQILFMQVCPSPTPPPPPVCTCGFDTTAPVISFNHVKFDDQTGTDLAQLTLEGFVCADTPATSNLTFTAISDNHSLSLSATGTNITVTCSSPGQPCTVTVTGTGTVTLDGSPVTPNHFVLTIMSTPGNIHYDLVVTSNSTTVFDTTGQVQVTGGNLVAFCPT